MPLARFVTPFEHPDWIFEPLCGLPHNGSYLFGVARYVAMI
jgi:hypothetical protein